MDILDDAALPEVLPVYPASDWATQYSSPFTTRCGAQLSR
jgi:hypothetical protein